MTEAEWFASDWPDDLLEHACSRRRAELGITGSSDDEERPGFRPRVYPRKRRLFIAACCRRIWKFLPAAAQNAVEVAEQFADGVASDGDRLSAVAQVEAAGRHGFVQPDAEPTFWEAARDALRAAGGAVLPFTDVDSCPTSLWIGPGERPFLDRDHYDGGFGLATCYAVNALAIGEDDPAGAVLLRGRWRFLHPSFVAEEGLPVYGTRWHTELLAQCELVRDIFGNPWRRIAMNPAWRTPTVARVAEAIYQDRAFDHLPILADALEDAGCQDADILGHCRGLGPHVRGCWVVDLLLGKT